MFLLEEFGKYLARLFTYDPVWNRLGTRFQEKERKKLLFCCSMSVGLRINRLQRLKPFEIRLSIIGKFFTQNYPGNIAKKQPLIGRVFSTSYVNSIVNYGLTL